MKYKVNDEVLIKARIKDMSYVDMMYVCELVTNPDVCIRFKSPTECIVPDKTYEMGLTDAWELAKKVVCAKGGMPYAEIEAIFGSGRTIEDILIYNTVEEALAKVEAYKKEKEIKPTDIVEYNGKNWVVTEVYKGEYSIWNGKKVIHTANVKKVGSVESIKPLEELLRQIGE